MTETIRSTASPADGTTEASPRLTMRFESSMSGLATASTFADRAQFSLLESTAGVVVEQALIGLEFPIPTGDNPFRCSTIAGAVAAWTEKEHRASANVDGPTDASAGSTGEEGFSTEVLPFDEEFARAQELAAATAEEGADVVADFPDFHPRNNFDSWVYDNFEADDLAEVTAIIGTTMNRTRRHVSHAMTIVHGLPRFAGRFRAGEFSFAHVETVAFQCQSVAFRFLPELDDYLATRRADVTCESLRSSLRKKINLLQPPVDRSDIASQRRRVDVEGRKDGSACLTLSGPSDEIFACFYRLEAMARTVHAKNISALNLPNQTEIIDDRAITNLMYDMAIRPVPQLRVKIRSIDPITGIQTTNEQSLLNAEGDLVFDTESPDGLADYARTLAPEGADGSAFSPAGDACGTGSDDADAAGTVDASGPGGPVEGLEYWVTVTMPTSQWWLANQAATVATVPFLTLTGDSDLPGTFTDGSPIPADMARKIAGRSKTIQRILTDPATGTPLDAKATSYAVPKDLRKTLVEQWTTCTVPGCPRAAMKAEIDHVIPFFHLNPIKGGLTRFGNIHPLCKAHHALKTARRYGVRMAQSGVVEYDFKHGTTVKAIPSDQPINVAHALEFARMTTVNPCPKGWQIPARAVPQPPMVLELMPGESTIRQRDEENRVRAEREAKDLALLQAYQEGRAARDRRMLAQSLAWNETRVQLCLPAGSRPLETKQLTGNPWRARRASGLPSEEMYRKKLDAKIRDALDRRAASTAASTRRDSTAWNSTTGNFTTMNAAQAARRTRDPWDALYNPKVKWEHDLETDPPPF